MSKISELVDNLSLTFQSSPGLKRSIYTELVRIISTAYTHHMTSDESYCFKFNLPMSAVSRLFKLCELTEKEVEDAFRADWKYPPKTKMYSDPYYHILLLLTVYGIKNKEKDIKENALLVALFKIWNGRKRQFLKYCDPKTMQYVIKHLCTNRHLFTKFDGPMSMLKDHFVPTLLKKYEPTIARNASQSKALFSQAYTRIRQLFVQNNRIDIRTKTPVSQGGILPMYMKAREEGLSIGSSNVRGLGLDEEPSFSDYTSTNERDEIISSTAEFITMNSNPNYATNFIGQINRDTKVSSKVIEKLLKSMHNHRYYNDISDALSIILSRTNVKDKSDICNNSYIPLVKKTVISSKNNADAKKLQTIINKLLEQICKTIQVDFKRYSNVQQIQMRTVIISGLVYNLRKNTCRTLSL